MERAQHAGNILEGRTLPATLCQRARGLAFEIDDDKVAAGEENLAEMIVAMNAGSHGRAFETREHLVAAAGSFFKSENFFRFLPGLVRHSNLEATKQVEIGGQELCRRFCERLMIAFGRWLGREIRVVCPGRQGQVKLGGPAAEESATEDAVPSAAEPAAETVPAETASEPVAEAPAEPAAADGELEAGDSEASDTPSA